MTFRQQQAARSDKALNALAAKVAAPGEFIHLTAAGLPRMASGQPVSRGALKKLVEREIVTVVQTDLIGRPMQYAAHDAFKAFNDAAARPLVERAMRLVIDPPLVVAELSVPVGSMPGMDVRPGGVSVVPAMRREGAKRWNDSNRLAARALWLSGESKAEVARRFFTSRGFIVRMARVDKWPATR